MIHRQHNPPNVDFFEKNIHTTTVTYYQHATAMTELYRQDDHDHNHIADKYTHTTEASSHL